MSDQAILELRGINKSFGPVDVLKGVDFVARAGEVTALVGDNGAGKSTLVKCVSGTYSIDHGEYLFDGKPVTVHSPRDASALGIEIVYQDLALCDNLDIVQNMFLGRERVSRVVLDESSMEQAAEETLRSLSVRTVKSVRQRVASLSGGQRQTVAIAKAVLWNSRVVVLDEPTAALGVAQTAQVLSLVRRLADRGLAVVLISHNMLDVLQVSDSIAVLYLGQMAAQVRRTDVNQQQLIQLITTGSLDGEAPGRDHEGCERMTSHHDDPTGAGAGTVAAPDESDNHDDLAAVASTVPSATTTREYLHLYRQRVQGGEMGSLPAVAGLIVLVILFSLLQPTFGGLYNFGNMLTEGSGPVLLAMGLIFVLLLGEIDLSAGFTGGVCAAVMVRLMVGYNLPWPISIGAGLVAGLFIGFLIGFLVAKVRIPSFVVTLAFFMTFQGVALFIVNNGPGAHGDVRITDPFVLAFQNSQMPKWAGWLLAVVLILGYAGTQAVRAAGPPPPGAGRGAQPGALEQDRRAVAGRDPVRLRDEPEPLDQHQADPDQRQRHHQAGHPARRRGRAVGGPGADLLLRAVDLRALPHPLRPAHLRRRRQRGGLPASRHHGRPGADLGLHALLVHGRGRRHHDRLERRGRQRAELRGEHPAAGRRRRRDRRHQPVRRQGPDDRRADRWRGRRGDPERRGLQLASGTPPILCLLTHRHDNVLSVSPVSLTPDHARIIGKTCATDKRRRNRCLRLAQRSGSENRRFLSLKNRSLIRIWLDAPPMRDAWMCLSDTSAHLRVRCVRLRFELFRSLACRARRAAFLTCRLSRA